MAKGLLPPKEVTGWRVVAREVVPHPQPGEAVSFTNFHKHGFMVPVFDFLYVFLHEYGVQLQHLPPNAVSLLAGFIIMCEAFLGIGPNKDLFQRVFKVKPRKVHGSDGGVLAPMGGMNHQMHHGVSCSYLCLSLKSSNYGWHRHWFYIQDDAVVPSLLSPASRR